MKTLNLFLSLLLSFSASAFGASAMEKLQELQALEQYAVTPYGLNAVPYLSVPSAVPALRVPAATVLPETVLDKAITMERSLTYIVDGDTIYYGATGTNKLKIRILGIDTPETKHNNAGKFEDQAFGQEAKKYARYVIRKAKKVQYLPVGIDKYGRTLAHVFVDGRLFVLDILRKGLAYETVSKYGDYGYPDLAAATLEASKIYPRKDFINPHDWRAREWSEEKEQAELQRDMTLPRIVLDKSRIIFDDGDTITYKNVTFRILGYDTPEIMHPEDGIFEDQPYGREAAALAEELITKAESVECIMDGTDKYGRTLAHVFVDGELLSVRIIKAGLAYESVSKFGANGFPGYSGLILAAFRSVP
ncbi:MAG: thermonuclease family protein, partial [bacterium]